MFTSFKATAISFKPKKWDKAHNADRIEALFRQATAHGPDLIVTTEGALEGYVVMDVIEDPNRATDMLEVAEPIDGPYIHRFRRLAQELRTCLCFGFAERIGNDVFNATVFIDGKGDICGKYHKTQLAEGATPHGGSTGWGGRSRPSILRSVGSEYSSAMTGGTR